MVTVARRGLTLSVSCPSPSFVCDVAGTLVANNCVFFAFMRMCSCDSECVRMFNKIRLFVIHRRVGTSKHRRDPMTPSDEFMCLCRLSAFVCSFVCAFAAKSVANNCVSLFVRESVCVSMCEYVCVLSECVCSFVCDVAAKSVAINCVSLCVCLNLFV